MPLKAGGHRVGRSMANTSKTKNTQAKNWCFTLNNYNEEEYQHICSVLEEQGHYWIAGREVGEGGTPHIQGYVSFPRRMYFNSVRSLLGTRVHLEVARGSSLKNRTYCSKDGNFREGGEPPKEGRPKRDRNDLAREFSAAITGGNAGLAAFADSEPGVWYFSGHNLLRNATTLLRPVLRPNINVLWIYGPPGVGKSNKAHEDLPEAYIKEPRTKWWNGYLGEKEVIIDDFGPGGIDINHLLRWFDRYKCLVENKGGMIPLLAETFIVTSNFHPRDIFKWGDEVNPQLPALERRIQLIHME